MSFNILTVDDSSTIRAIIKRSIMMSGMEVGEFHEAANGLEALEILDKHWIDIVLTDLNMPELDGQGLIEKMSEDDMLTEVPVVVISSVRDQATIDALNARGVKAYLRKPARPEDLRNTIEAITGGSHER